MDKCTPAHTVYGNGMDCLPYTGSDTMLMVAVGLAMVVIGIAIALTMRHLDNRRNADSDVPSFMNSN